MAYKSFVDRILHEKKFTVATIITLLRIGLVPLFILGMIYQAWYVAFVVFVIASASDAIDGNLARSRNEQTLLGACLDPLADKLLLIGCFGAFSFIQNPFFAMPQWFFWTLVIKECVLVLGFLLLYNIKGSFDVKPTLLAKINTAAELIFIVLIFVYGFMSEKNSWILYSILYGLTVLMAVTLLHYIIIGYCILRNR